MHVTQLRTSASGTIGWMFPLLLRQRSLLLGAFATIFLATVAFADNSQTDSANLRDRLAESSGPERTEILIDLAELTSTTSLTQSLAYGHEALTLARSAGDSTATGQSLCALSQAHFYACQYDKSLAFGLQAARVAEYLGKPKFQVQVLNALGTISQKQYRFEAAATHYGLALDAARRANDKLGEARNLNSLGVNAWYQEDYELALEFYKKGLVVQMELGDPVGLSAALNNVAMIHHIREEYAEAIDFYEQSLAIKRQNDLTGAIAATLGNLGELYLELEQYPAALKNLEGSRDLAAKNNAEDVLKNSYYSLATYYEKMGDHAVALDNYKLGAEMEHKIYSARNASIIAEMQAKYDAEIKNSEIERLNLANGRAEQDLASQRQARDRTLVGLLLMTAMAISLAALYRRQAAAHRRVSTQAQELAEAASKIDALTKLLPICANCKMIRDQGGQWHQLESYLTRHTEVTFTHGICPGCSATILEEMAKT